MNNEYKLTNQASAFLLNFLPGGIGSFTQGNTAMGIYRIISDVVLITNIITLNVLGPPPGNWIYMNYMLVAHSVGAIIVSLISPWVYQSKYNNTLSLKLGLNRPPL